MIWILRSQELIRSINASDFNHTQHAIIIKKYQGLAMSLELSSEIYDRYSSGYCMQLAAALSRRLGWKIQAVVSQDQNPNYIEHAWVIDPFGKLMLDIDGLNPVESNGWIHPTGTLHEDISEDSLKSLITASLSISKLFDESVWECEVEMALTDIMQSSKIQKIIANNDAILNQTSKIHDQVIDGNGFSF
jgi:hypothetical protein